VSLSLCFFFPPLFYFFPYFRIPVFIRVQKLGNHAGYRRSIAGLVRRAGLFFSQAKRPERTAAPLPRRPCMVHNYA
jgi:hypothetical protein